MSEEAKQRPTLETQRLILRPFDLSDASEVQRLAGDFAIADMTLLIPHPYEAGMAEEWISAHQANFESGKDVTFAVTLRCDGALLGAMSFTLKNEYRRAELGYWIGKPYWGQGYCTEAAEAIVRYAFTQMDLNRVCAFHFARNPASGRVMQKIGMVCEGTYRQHVMRWDKYEDLVAYAILREDWAKKHVLEAGGKDEENR